MAVKRRKFRRLVGLILLPLLIYSKESSCSIDSNGKEVCVVEEKKQNSTPDSTLDRTSTDGTTVDASSCGLYLAPSTIPNAGIGIFTGRALRSGDEIDMQDVAIPLIDMKAHYFFTQFDERRNDDDSTLRDATTPEYDHSQPDWFFPFESYIWQGWAMGMLRESTPMINDIEAYCPGLDAAINSHLALVNVGGSDASYDLSNIHRSTHAMAGSYSPYMLGGTKAIEEIPAGGECFKSYGDYWFVYRQYLFGELPLTNDHVAAEEALERFLQVTQGLSKELKQNIWDFVMHVMKPKLGPSRFLNALPESLEDAEFVGTEGIRAYYQPNATRSLEELDRIGRCIDHMYADASTLPQAGKGAFVRHALRKGEIVSATPLLHQPYRSIAKVHHLAVNPETGNVVRISRDASTEQILVNYCFTHSDTTLLLCPYGAGVNYINHNQTQANIKVQWVPDTVLGHNASWLELPVEQMVGNGKVSLIMEYVALRDLQVGEELFLDYGDEFEAALQKHFQEWKPPPKGSRWRYETSHIWNARFHGAPLRTYAEQQLDPYPPHLETHCHPRVFGNSLGDPPDEFAEMSFDLNQRGIPCWVMDRYVGRNGDIVYDVDGPHYHEANYFVRKRHVTRENIVFGDRPYSSDLHLSGAFRHAIHMPNEMLPEAWRNNRH